MITQQNLNSISKNILTIEYALATLGVPGSAVGQSLAQSFKLAINQVIANCRIGLSACGREAALLIDEIVAASPELGGTGAGSVIVGQKLATISKETLSEAVELAINSTRFKTAVLYSKRPTSFDPIDPTQLLKIKEAFAQQGKIIDNSEDALRYLETRGAEGVTFNAETILIRPDASASTVFEELIHATQYRTGKFDQWVMEFGSNGAAVARAEYEAASRLVKNQKAYNISDAEHDINLSRVSHYKSELQKLGITVE